MNLRVVALVAGLLGGGCWAARWAADLAGSTPTWTDQSYWAGLALLGIALAFAGAGLVSRSAVWLRLFVALAFPALVWSVYAVVRGGGDAVMLDGVLGAVAIVGSVVVFVLTRGHASDASRSRRGHGSHAR